MGAEVTVQQIPKGSYFIVIPKSIAEALGITKGVKVELIIDRGDLLVRKKL